jgi:hypothetical protein
MFWASSCFPGHFPPSSANSQQTVQKSLFFWSFKHDVSYLIVFRQKLSLPANLKGGCSPLLADFRNGTQVNRLPFTFPLYDTLVSESSAFLLFLSLWKSFPFVSVLWARLSLALRRNSTKGWRTPPPPPPMARGREQATKTRQRAKWGAKWTGRRAARRLC